MQHVKVSESVTGLEQLGMTLVISRHDNCGHADGGKRSDGFFHALAKKPEVSRADCNVRMPGRLHDMLACQGITMDIAEKKEFQCLPGPPF
jgi:hypothetical protein